MADQSELEGKYFLDGQKYNCPFCKIRSVGYSVTGKVGFNWSEDRTVYIYLTKCDNSRCQMISAHYSDWYWNTSSAGYYPFSKKPNDYDSEKNGEYDDTELDGFFFYHQPTSYFTIDVNIPLVLRNLISEAEGCRKMSWMVGASGALRKAIYEFLKLEKAEGDSYEEKIKFLKANKAKYPKVDEELFNALDAVQGMTSIQLHEQDGSFEPWTPGDFDYFLENVKETFKDVYVTPKIISARHNKLSQLINKTTFSEKEKKEGSVKKEEIKTKDSLIEVLTKKVN